MRSRGRELGRADDGTRSRGCRTLGRRLLAVDLDAPVPVVVPSIFGVGAEAPRAGHALRASKP